MKKTHILVIGLLAACIMGCAAHRTTPRTFKPQPPGTLRVVTYNVNWQNEKKALYDSESVIEALTIVHGDVLLLQEVTLPWEKVLKSVLQRRFPYWGFYHYENAGGLGIFSRYPFRTLKKLPPKHGWHPAWIVSIQTAQGKIQVMNTHLIPPLNKRESIGFLGHNLFNTLPKRKREIVHLHKYLRQDWPTIVAGDFNEEAHGVAADFLRSQGFQDALVQNGNKNYTWEWTFLGLLHISAKLDEVYYRPVEKFRVLQAQVLHHGSSDHYPVVVDFMVNP